MSATWISDIDDSVRVNRLVIPGTHDAASWIKQDSENWIVSTFTWAQRLNIAEQLNAGVRALDLRIGLRSGVKKYTTDDILMYHGPREVNDQNLDDVLGDVKSFLDTNEDEFVILMFQQQGRSDTDCAKGVAALLTKHFGVDNFYRFTKKKKGNLWPTVGQLRGRVMVLERLKSRIRGCYDVSAWPDNPKGTKFSVAPGLKVYLQDNYKKVSSSWFRDAETNDKIKTFRAAITAASKLGFLSRVLQIHHTSYSNKRYEPWTTGQIINTKLKNIEVIANFTRGLVMIDDADSAICDYLRAYNT